MLMAGFPIRKTDIEALSRVLELEKVDERRRKPGEWVNSHLFLNDEQRLYVVGFRQANPELEDTNARWPSPMKRATRNSEHPSVIPGPTDD